MPETRRPGAALLTITILAAIVLTALWRPAAQAQNDRAGNWEYAIIKFRVHDAVLFTNTETFYIEGPDVRNPERVTGEQGLRLVRPIEVEHLTKLGRSGWEVVEVWPRESNSFLLRRRL